MRDGVFIGHSLEAFHAAVEQLTIIGVITEARASDGPVAEDARARGIDLELVTDARQVPVALSRFSCELVLMCEFGLILPHEGLEGCTVINVHPGLVPDNRGRHPLPQAILHGDEYMGVTALIADLQLIDAGEILCRLEAPIDYESDYNTNNERLRRMLRMATDDAIRQVLSGQVADNSYLFRCRPNRYRPPVERGTLERIINLPSLMEFRA